MKKKILLVEDERDFVVAVTAVLESEGYEVAVANDGKAGLQKAKADIFDLIILDVMIPKIDGYKVCRMLKFDKNYKDTPVLMLTAKVQEQDRLTGEQCGADAYVLKSQGPDALVGKIKELLK